MIKKKKVLIVKQIIINISTLRMEGSVEVYADIGV